MAYSDEVLADSPVAYWRLGEAAGSTSVADSTTNANTGTVTGATLGSASLLTGDANTAATFDGVDDKIDVTDSASLQSPSTALAVEFWIKLSDVVTRQTVFSRYDTTGNLRVWSVEVMNSDVGLFVGTSGGAGFIETHSNDVLTVNIVHHVVCKWDAAANAGACRIFVDGVEVPSYRVQASTTAALPAVSVPTRIGYGYAGRYTIGTVDEAAIYPGLSDARIADHYTAGIGGTVIATETQKMPPDAILAMSGLTGTVAAIQDDPASPDANWLTAS